MNAASQVVAGAQDSNTRYIDGGTAVLSQHHSPPGQTQQSNGDGTGANTKRGDEGKSKPLLESKLPAAPSLSLPPAGGAIRGMGEKFNVNSSSGSGSFSIPVKIPPGRSGLQPNLALSYDSSGGNGEFGLGWRLSGIDAITRKTSKGLPRYNDHGSDEDGDVFLLAGSEDLVPLWKRDHSGQVVVTDTGRPALDEAVVDGYIVRAFAPRIITVFNRVERWVSVVDRNDIHWRVISPDNITGIFGSTESSRIYDTSTNSTEANPRIFSWLQSEVYDPFGNAITFSYKREDSNNVQLNVAHELNRSEQARRSNLYLKTIRYGNVTPNRDLNTWKAFSAFSLPQDATTWKYSVVMDYGEHHEQTPKPDDPGSWTCRFDPFSRHMAGFEVRTYRLCRRILTFHHFKELGVQDYLVSSVDLAYDEGPAVTFLIAAEQVGYSGDVTTGQPPLRKSLPPVELTYSRFPDDEQLAKVGVEDVDPASLENLPVGLDESTYRWVDIDGEGLSGILTLHKDAWYYKRNTSASNFSSASSTDGLSDGVKPTARFGPLQLLNHGPFSIASTMHMQFSDVNGNGKLDLVSHASSMWGYFERDEDESLGWTEFRSFKSFPSVQPDRSTQFIDLTGDGLADVLIYDDQVFTWYQSLGADGYGPPETSAQAWDETKGPVCVFADGEQSIYLADMSGDGLVDLCRIRNGDCCYWPQLGYGQFGSQVCFDNAPWFNYSDQFNRNRVRVVDIDGSGTSDILYLSSEGVDIYLNQSGNSFSDRKRVSLPFITDLSAIQVIDLLGNGTRCLVWSSPLPGDAASPMRYVDIFRNEKPNFLTKVTNNLGEETRVHYAPSTKFYLEDEQSGRPWITKLHFPVQCVERVETMDIITGNKFVTSFRYAHGFYDGVEREFRGFARVEQTDSDNFAGSRASTNANVAWDVPPVRTISWFHTGAYFKNKTLGELLEQEYFDSASTESKALRLEHTIIPDECTEGVQRMEACRALKGRKLRTEVYADDGTDKAGLPYSAEEANFSLVPTQVVMDAHVHGVYFVHSRETLACSYERVVQDPRIAHHIILETDSFGNVLKDLRISYGRRSGQSSLDALGFSKQETMGLLYNEMQFTNSLAGDQYRAPVPCQSRQFEIRGLKPTGTDTLFRFDVLTANSFDAILSLPEIAFEDDNNPSLLQKRLLRQERALFKSDGLAHLLPLGVIEPLCLPGAYHKRAFTPGLFSKLFTRINQAGSLETLLAPAHALSNGYVDLDRDGSLWTASTRVSYDESTTSTPDQELAAARRNFFLPKTFVDIFNNPLSVAYDDYHLFPTRTLDAANNATSILMDYRAVQPSRIKDANGNISSAAYDAMGMVAGVAMSGKPSENLGDTLEGFNADLPQDQLDGFLANPTAAAASSLLGNATSRIIYDPWRAKSTGAPVYSAFISRETHVNFPTPVGGPLFQVQLSYSDGFGRIIQAKTRAKPGPIAEGGPVINDRWVGSGWTIFNNKGKPVRQFEPFFDDTPAFQSDFKVGVSPTLLYDPLGRVVAVLRPDHSIEKTVFSSWAQKQFDANDNVLLSDPRRDPDVGALFSSIPEAEVLPSWYDARKSGALGRAEQDAAGRTLSHNDTPKTAHLDNMGRTFLVVTTTGSEDVAVRTDLDILGNSRVTWDALSRKSVVSDFDMCQRQIRTSTIDSGTLWKFLDGSDQGAITWNNRGFRFRIEYDMLRRPTLSWWQDAGASVEVLTSQTIYGESFPSSADDSAASHNLRTRVWQVLDQSGIIANTDYDWDGNLTRSTKRLATDYKETVHVSNAMSLEEEVYVSTSSFDLLRRPIRSEAPDGTITYRVYNQSAQLNSMYVNSKHEQDPASNPLTWTSVFTDVQYNAKGQITSTVHGNGTITARSYDRLLNRLQRLRTTNQDGKVLQDLEYTYDPVGNISHVQDSAQQTIFFRNAVVDPSNDYTYDALYRLVSASGREHLGQTNGCPNMPTAPNWTDKTHNATSDDARNGQVMGTYKESYKYDVAGNLLSVQHAGSSRQSPGWTRSYTYSEPSLLESGRLSNRLSQTSVGTAIETYRYDGSAGLSGNMSSMSHLPLMSWNFADQLKATSTQRVAEGSSQIPEITYYVYDIQGNRVRKVTESQAGGNTRATPVKLQERIYLGGYEIFRKYNGSSANTVAAPTGSGQPSAGNGDAGSDEQAAAPLALERTTFHASTEYGHIADICTRTVGDDDGVPRQVRFQLQNHLGSAVLELDEAGALLSYEEYFPFGSTSYKAVASQTDASKRFRFTGKELDTENGLYYFNARYYAAWLGRWTAADPVVGPGSRYDYVSNNPIRLVDPDGRAPQPAPAGGGGGGGSNGGWVDVSSGGVLGALVHNVTLAVLQERLLFRAPPHMSFAEYRTLEGGSKNNPNGNTTGEIDLAVLEWSGLRQWMAHVYELKPDNKTGNLPDSKSYRHQSETQLYSKYFPTDLGPLGRVVGAQSGGIIEDLDRQDKSSPGSTGILDPIEFKTPLGDVRIKLRLQESGSKGHKVRGLILYQVQIRPRKGKATRALAEEAFKWFLAAQAALQSVQQAAKAQQQGGKQVAQPTGQGAAQPAGQGAGQGAAQPATARTGTDAGDTKAAEEGGNWKWWALGGVAVLVALTGVGLVAEGSVAAGAGGVAAATTEGAAATTTVSGTVASWFTSWAPAMAGF